MPETMENNPGEVLTHLKEAVECMEEMTIILAEVHVRFGPQLMLANELGHEIKATYGEAAKMYAQVALRLRNKLIELGGPAE